MEAFEVISTGKHGRAEARLILQRCFADLIDEEEQRGGYVPRSTNPDEERFEQLALSQEAERELRNQVVDVNFKGMALTQAEVSLGKIGNGLEDFSEAAQVDLLTGIVRAMIQRERLFRLRIEDRLAPFEVDDPFFRSSAAAAAAAAPASGTPAPGPSVVGPSTRHAIEM